MKEACIAFAWLRRTAISIIFRIRPLENLQVKCWSQLAMDLGKLQELGASGSLLSSFDAPKPGAKASRSPPKLLNQLNGFKRVFSSTLLHPPSLFEVGVLIMLWSLGLKVEIRGLPQWDHAFTQVVFSASCSARSWIIMAHSAAVGDQIISGGLRHR